MKRFAWSMAIRSLRHKPGLTLLTIGIVVVSVTLIISLNTLMSGVQKRIVSAVTDTIAHVSIQPEERMPVASWRIRKLQKPGTMYVGELVKRTQVKKKIEEWKIWLPRVRRFDPLIQAVTPVASEQAILYRGAQPQSVKVLGVIPKEYNQVVDVQSKLVKGQFFRMTTGQIVIGKTLADEYTLSLGDKVRLSASTENAASSGNTATYTIIGIFTMGSRMADLGQVFIPLRDAQSLFGLGQAITSMEIKIRDIFSAATLAQRLQYRVPYLVRSWMEDNQNILTAIQSQDMTTNIILLLTTLASGMGIASILIMAVVGKLRELGILIAMGATRLQIILAYTLQGVLVSFFGAVLGTGAGIVLARWMASFTERDATGKEVPFLAIEFRYEVIGLAFAVALLVGLMASLYPAWRASRVNPIEVIRGA